MSDARHSMDLDPMRDPDRWEALVNRIQDAAEPMLSERREQASVALVLERWNRPVLSVAGALMAACMAWLFVHQGDLSTLLDDEATGAVSDPVAAAMVPEVFADWLEGTSTPTLYEVVEALEEGD